MSSHRKCVRCWGGEGEEQEGVRLYRLKDWYSSCFMHSEGKHIFPLYFYCSERVYKFSLKSPLKSGILK